METAGLHLLPAPVLMGTGQGSNSKGHAGIHFRWTGGSRGPVFSSRLAWSSAGPGAVVGLVFSLGTSVVPAQCLFSTCLLTAHFYLIILWAWSSFLILKY